MKKFLLILVTLIVTISSTACFPYSMLRGDNNSNSTSQTDFTPQIRETNVTIDNDMSSSKDCFTGKSFTAGDGSLLYLYDDGTYEWFQNPDILDDNYYSGDYEVYGGYDAIDYVATDIPEYGLTKTEMLSSFSEDIDNLYCLTLSKTSSVVDGVYSTDTNFTPYLGIYYEPDKDFYSLNLNTANYSDFTLN